jgi:hypothetical protein
MLQTCHTAVEESPLFIFTHHFLSFCQLCRQGPHVRMCHAMYMLCVKKY